MNIITGKDVKISMIGYLRQMHMLAKITDTSIPLLTTDPLALTTIPSHGMVNYTLSKLKDIKDIAYYKWEHQLQYYEGIFTVSLGHTDEKNSIIIFNIFESIL